MSREPRKRKARLAEMAAQDEERGETALDDSHWISCAERGGGSNQVSGMDVL